LYEVLEILRMERLPNLQYVFLIRWSTEEWTWQFEHELESCEHELLKFFETKSVPLEDRPYRFRTLEVENADSEDGYCAKRAVEYIIQQEIPGILPRQPFSYYESKIQSVGYRLKRLSDPEKKVLSSLKSGKLLCYTQAHLFVLDLDLGMVIDSDESRPIAGNIPFFKRAYYLQKK
jgi:hypothetical protein